MSTPQISIVIPAYNESARIENALLRVLSCIEDRQWDAEVLVVDDGSTDSTVAIVQDWMKRYPQLQLCAHQRSQLSCRCWRRNGWVPRIPTAEEIKLQISKYLTQVHMIEVRTHLVPNSCFVWKLSVCL